MKSSYKSSYSLFVVGVIVAILLGVSIISYYYISRDKSFNFDNSFEKYVDDKYSMTINYPKFNSNNVNKDIKKIINIEKNDFLSKVDDVEYKENELNISYSYSEKDNIYSVHLRSYSYVGENKEYYRKDEIFYLDKVTNKEVSIDDLIIDDKIYEVFKQECYNYLVSHKGFIDLYDVEQFTDNIEAKKENYKILIFSNNALYIVFAPHMVSPYDGEINIEIKYDLIKEYLNKDYFSSLFKDEKKDNVVEKIKVEKIRDKSLFEGKKLLAFTFDDGPHAKNTRLLLQGLKERNARVSFFMLGELASKQSDLVLEVYQDGHTIASHTYDHKNLKNLDDTQLSYEIDYTNQVLKNIISEDIKYVRPPYGAYNEDILSKVNMSFILWSVDTEDWKLRDASKITDYTINNVQDGDIVLFHDIHSETIDGVLKAIDYLTLEGYAFVSLDELLAYRDIKIESNTAYRHFRLVSNEDVLVDSET